MKFHSSEAGWRHARALPVARLLRASAFILVGACGGNVIIEDGAGPALPGVENEDPGAAGTGAETGSGGATASCADMRRPWDGSWENPPSEALAGHLVVIIEDHDAAGNLAGWSRLLHHSVQCYGVGEVRGALDGCRVQLDIDGFDECCERASFDGVMAEDGSSFDGELTVFSLEAAGGSLVTFEARWRPVGK